MNTRFPIPVQVAVTFTAEAIAFIKMNEFSIVEPQFIPIFCIMAVKTPPHRFGMVKLDL